MAGMHPETGRFTRGGEEIIIAVRKAMTTPKATRVMRRWLGVSSAALLDRPTEPGMVGPITLAIGESLAAEPRVRLNRMALSGANQEGHAELIADLTVTPSGQQLRQVV